MTETKYSIDCSKINSYEDFIRAFNTGMIDKIGGNWNGNLDAFKDYLAWPEQIPYTLVIVGRDRCQEILNYKKNPGNSDTIWNIIQEILTDAKDFVDVELT